MHVQDMERQALNVFRMRLLGAEVRPVTSGTCTLKDATSEAIRDWVTNVESTHYILGSTAGPHPYPMMVRRILQAGPARCCCCFSERLQLGWALHGHAHQVLQVLECGLAAAQMHVTLSVACSAKQLR